MVRHWRSEKHAGCDHRTIKQGSRRQHCRFQIRRAARQFTGAAVLAGSPGDFAKLISDETRKGGNVILAANIKAP
jgi:hypothetical protein